jgi:hypothetical protein
MVKEIARKHGYFATFMPKPFAKNAERCPAVVDGQNRPRRSMPGATDRPIVTRE